MNQNTYVLLYINQVASYYVPNLLQNHRKYGEPVKLSAAKMISSNKKDELLQRNDMRRSLRMSTSGRGKKTTFI